MQLSSPNSATSFVPVSKRCMRVSGWVLAFSLVCALQSALSDVVGVDTGPFADGVVLTNLVFVDYSDYLDYKSSVVARCTTMLDSIDFVSDGLSTYRSSSEFIASTASNIFYHVEAIHDLRDDGEISGSGTPVLIADVNAIYNDATYIERVARNNMSSIDALIYSNQLLRAECNNIIRSASNDATVYTGIFATSVGTNSAAGGCCQCPDYSNVLAFIANCVDLISGDMFDIRDWVETSMGHLYDILTFMESTWDNSYRSMLRQMEDFWNSAQFHNSIKQTLGDLVYDFTQRNWGIEEDQSMFDWLRWCESSFWYVALGLLDIDDWGDGFATYNRFLIPLHNTVSNVWYQAFDPSTYQFRARRYDEYLGQGAVLAAGEPTSDMVASDNPINACIGLLYRIQHLLTSNVVSRVDEKEREEEEKSDADDAQQEVEDTANEDVTLHTPFDLTLGFLSSLDNLDNAIQAIKAAITVSDGLVFVLTDASGITVQLGNERTKATRPGVVKIVGDAHSGWSQKCLSVLRTCFTILWLALAAYLAFSLASWIFRLCWTVGSIGLQAIGGDFSGVVQIVQKLGERFAGDG